MGGKSLTLRSRHARDVRNFRTCVCQRKVLRNVISDSFSGEWGDECITDGGVSVLRTVNFTNDGSISYAKTVRRLIKASKVEAKKLRFGDIIVEKSGGTKDNPVGRVVFFDRTDQVFLTNNFTQVLRPDSTKVFPRYLLYVLLALYKMKVTESLYNKTTGIQNIQIGKYLDLQIPLPDLPVQKRITAELDKICALKKNAETRLEKIELLVKSRFAEMFGGNEVWRKVGLLDVGECKNGINFAPNECGYELRCIGVSNFKNFAEISNVESMPLVSLNARPSDDLLLRDGDMLFVRSNGNKNLVGRCVVVHPGDTEVTFSGFCIRYRLTSKKLDALYVVHYLRQSQVRRLLQGRGANIQNMSQRTLAGLSIPIPPLSLQREFAAFVVKVDKLASVVRETVRQMDVLYRSKLQEYFG